MIHNILCHLQHCVIEVLRMGIQEALEFFEIPKGRRQTLENVRILSWVDMIASNGLR